MRQNRSDTRKKKNNNNCSNLREPPTPQAPRQTTIIGRIAKIPRKETEKKKKNPRKMKTNKTAQKRMTTRRKKKKTTNRPTVPGDAPHSRNSNNRVVPSIDWRLSVIYCRLAVLPQPPKQTFPISSSPRKHACASPFFRIHSRRKSAGPALAIYR